MEGLEKLRPFVRFCQIVGFFPFRMETDLQSGKLKRFTFSFRHPVTWWYMMILILCGIQIGMHLLCEMNTDVLEATQKLDYRLRMCFSVFSIIGITLTIFWRCTGFHLSYFGKALQLAIKVDQNLEFLTKKSVHKDTLTLRIYIGLIVTVTMVKFIDFLRRNNRNHQSNSFDLDFI